MTTAVRWAPHLLVLLASCTLVAACGATGPAKLGQPVKASAKVALAKAVLLDSPAIQKHNLEMNALGHWGKALPAQLQRGLGADSINRDVIVQLTLHRDRDPEISIAARPPLILPARQKIVEALRKIQAPRTKLFAFSMRFFLKVNQGCQDAKLAFFPLLETPAEELKWRFKRLSTAKQLQHLRRWAREAVLPALAASVAGAAPKFKGVREVGRTVSALDLSRPVNVAAITERRESYWRANLEMTPADQSIPAIRIFLHTARGELDRAQRQLFLASTFASSKTSAGYFMSELKWRLAAFYAALSKRIAAGIARYDKRQYAPAARVFRGVLKDYPGSAWATYELYLTHQTQALKGSTKDTLFKDWSTAKRRIYQLDPLFATNVKATTGREGYLLFRRMKLKELFKQRARFKQDILEYADIALDLGVYGEAAQTYYFILQFLKPKDVGKRNILAHFLYCLEQLGISGLKANFKGDHAKSFKQIAAQRLQQMRASKLYQSFSRKGGRRTK